MSKKCNLQLDHITPFVPRSQIHQKQHTATTPDMSVVENNPPETTSRHLAEIPPSSKRTDKQITELNELLAHVLDEL